MCHSMHRPRGTKRKKSATKQQTPHDTSAQDTKQTADRPLPGLGRAGESRFTGDRGSVWADENVLDMLVVLHVDCICLVTIKVVNCATYL